ncbi:MAG: Dabb family protein [Bryobacterales bacterium]|nr:Dabb family protein [Bryobacterales bacterium]
MKLRTFLPLAACVASLILSAGAASAGEKTLMHCFAFTVIDSASDADWKAFGASTDALPSRIPGLRKVWRGKLVRPLAIFNPDAETRKKAAAGGSATGQITALQRQHGVCMEFDNQDALKVYAAHPAHAEWVKHYEKVRRPGTTTYDILGE